MERSTMEKITDRLATLTELYFPSTPSHPLNASERKSALFSLISGDPPIFVERYGHILTSIELSSFDPLISDYEVRFHVTHLRRSKSTSRSNRRRAHIEKLVREGEYFSEDSMREREPYLHQLLTAFLSH